MTASKITAGLDHRREGRGRRCQFPVHESHNLVVSSRERRLLIRYRDADGAAGIRPSERYIVCAPIERTLDAPRWGSA
jgi:hypothetical protein